MLGFNAGDWSKLKELGWAQRRDLLEAWWGVVWASIALRRPASKTLEHVARSEPAEEVPADERDLRRARAAARLVAVAASRSPVRARCLERSLALSRMLARRGIPAVVRIGVRRDGAGLEAHAWVECAGESLDPEHPRAERFEPFPAGFGARSQKKNKRSVS